MALISMDTFNNVKAIHQYPTEVWQSTPPWKTSLPLIDYWDKFVLLDKGVGNLKLSCLHDKLFGPSVSLTFLVILNINIHICAVMEI